MNNNLGPDILGVCEIEDEDGRQSKGAALRIYKGDPEEYWTFITPEACNALDIYREKWRSDIGRYPHPHDPLLKLSYGHTITAKWHQKESYFHLITIIHFLEQ